MGKRTTITIAVCVLVLTCAGTCSLLTNPAVVGESIPAVSELDAVGLDPVGAKLTPEEKLAKLRERNRHREFNREHPSLFAQFVGNLYSNTVGPVLGIMGMIKAAPYVIGLGCLLVCGLLLSWIYRAIRCK